MDNNIHSWLLRGMCGLVCAVGLASCGLLAPQQGRSHSDVALEDVALQNFMVGTFTDVSEGVYSFSFNPQSREIKHRGTFVTPYPTHLALDRERGIVYIANQLASEATVSSAQLDGVSGRLSAINSAYTIGDEPRSIATDSKGKVVTANYSGGSITLFMADETGLLSSPDWHIVLGPEGESRPTSVCFSPDGEELFVVDSGMDKIFHFNVSSTNPPLTIDTEGTELPAGTKPLVMTMSPSGEYAYLLTEAEPTLFVYSHSGGKLSEVQKVPLGVGGKGYHVVLSRDGGFLYVSTDGDRGGLMTIYKVDKRSGRLTQVGRERLGGEPIHFALSESGRVLAVASRGRDKVEFYSRDMQSGQLQPMTDLSITTQDPAFILWIYR